MNFKKEKNLFIAYDDMNRVHASYDWVQGVSYGAKGQIIKNIPYFFRYYGGVYMALINLRECMKNDLVLRLSAPTEDNVLNRVLDNYERLASVGIVADSPSFLADSLPTLNKDFINFLKEKYAGIYRSEYYENYIFRKNNPELNELSSAYEDIFVNYFMNESPTLRKWFLKAFLRVDREDCMHLYNGNYWNVIHLLHAYYDACMTMYGEAPITKNFATTIAHTMRIYKDYKENHYEDMIKKFNDLPGLYYENDTYIVRPLLNRDDFHQEAKAQGNCVERLYMDKVATGSTHVVTVRYKNTPEESLITCEISNDGNIQQYLARFNHRPDKQESTFKKELQNYLNETFKRD